MFLHEARQIMRKFLQLRPCSPENSKQRSFHVVIFSNNSVQVPSSMHFNVQLLYLLLFFAVVVGIAVLVA